MRYFHFTTQQIDRFNSKDKNVIKEFFSKL